MLKVWTTTLALLALAATALAGPPVKMFVEAEDGQGLIRYPYHNEEATGWYAREANARGYNAPGRGYCAAIHDNATDTGKQMTIPLPQHLPPGKYRVFLRTIGPRVLLPQDTIVRLGLGTASVDVKWNKPASWNFAWQPGVAVEIKEPVDAIKVTAVQFGGAGFRSLYEPTRKSIWIDTVYLTSDAAETAPPELAQELAMQAGADAKPVPPRATYASDEQHKTPLPEVQVAPEPIQFAAFDGRANLWPNSSFELGMNDGWAGTQPYCFTDKDLDDKNPFEGKYSLHIPAPPDASLNVPGPEPEVRLTPGIYPFSRPYFLAEGGPLTFSVYVRGSAVPITAKLKKIPASTAWGDVDSLKQGITVALTATGKLTPAWQRLTASGQLTPGWYYLSFECPGEFWIDAIQLERGAQATAYHPRAILEGALRTGQLANIVQQPQRTLDAWFHNSGDQAVKASLAYRIRDMRERVVAEGVTDAVELAASSTKMLAMPVLPDLRGVFSITYSVQSRATNKSIEGETAYTVMPKPLTTPVRHELGVNTTLHPVDLATHARLGIKWVLTCKSLEVGTPVVSGATGVHPSPDVWRWQDARVAHVAAYGMKLLPGFWPTTQYLPAFMRDTISSNLLRTTMGDDLRTMVPAASLWPEYVAKVASHYRDKIQFWNIDDEVEMHWDPKSFAPVAQSTLDSLHKNVPGVQGGTSATPEFTEELLRYVDPKSIDFFGGSTFDFQYWQARYVKRIKEQYNKRWVSYGVGGRAPAATMYHSLYQYQPIRWNAAWMARQMVQMVLLQDLDIIGHYSGIWRNYGHHLPGDKPLLDYDGTPLPWGGTFGVMGTLLADAKPLDDIPLGDTGRRVYLFQLGDQLAAVTWATCVRTYDHHFKPDQRHINDLMLNCPADSVKVQDMFMNPDTSAAWRDQKLHVVLDEEPTFIMNGSLTREQFIAMLGSAEAKQPAIEPTAFEFVSDDHGKLSVRVTAQNHTGHALPKMTVDLRTPNDKPMSMAAEWIFPEPFQTIGDVANNAPISVTVPTLLDGREPFEDGHVRAVLHAGDGSEAVMEDWLWLLPAPRAVKPPVIDGKLNEWEGRSPAWISYDWGWSLMGRSTVQLYEGGEHFGFPPYTLDARVAIWTSWDQDNLYLAIRLEDDDLVLDPGHGEHLRVVLSPSNGQAHELLLRPDAKGGGQAVLTTPDGTKQSLTMKSSVQASEKTLGIEIAVPWKSLNAQARGGQLLRFDLAWTDVDHESGKLVEGTMRWAGGSRGAGWLLLRP